MTVSALAVSDAADANDVGERCFDKTAMPKQSTTNKGQDDKPSPSQLMSEAMMV